MKLKNDIKKTSLYDNHLRLNGNIVDFSGTYLPVFYTSIQEEHNSVRNNIGIFDVSHMGNLIVISSNKNSAIEFFNYLLPNDFSNIYPGKCIYSAMLYENGTIVDDIIVMSISDNIYHIIVNASNIEKDYEWILSKNINTEITVQNKSDDFSMIAIQGPNSLQFLLEQFNFDIKDMKSFQVKKINYDNSKILISKTGYTGETGFEVVLSNDKASEFFDELLKKGKDYNLLPCGLGSRNTLRLESALPLYGHELDDQHSPLQTNMAWSVRLSKTNDFIGKNALLNLQNKYQDALVGFEVTGRAIPRNGMYILNSNNKIIGYVTSGTFSPSLQKNIGLAFIKTEYLNKNNLYIEVRNRIENIKLVDLPFYKRRK